MNQLLGYPSILFVFAQLVACGQEPAPANPVSPVLSEADAEFAGDTAEYFEETEC